MTTANTVFFVKVIRSYCKVLKSVLQLREANPTDTHRQACSTLEKKRNMNTENQRLERENIFYATKSISDPGEHPAAHIQLTFINQLLCAKCWIKKGIYLPEGSKVIYLERSCRIRTLLSGTYPVSSRLIVLLLILYCQFILLTCQFPSRL